MSDLISREALMAAFRRHMVEKCDREKCVSEENCKICERGCMWRNITMAAPTVDAVEVGSCDGCIYANRKRPQKCSCCRRNRDMKDCYEED